MIDLKNYQNDVVNVFENFLNKMNVEGLSHNDAFDAIQIEDGTNRKYVTNGSEIPSICIQIPTGGGKTIVACHLLHTLYQIHLQKKNDKGIVLWMVPTKIIEEQTLAALRNSNHPYRETLDEFFNNNILIFDSDEMKTIQPSDISDNLCIIVTTIAKFRISDISTRHAYDASGDLLVHFQNITSDKEALIRTNFNGEKMGRESLVNMIRINDPVIIADESHKAQTELTIEMYENLNPCFHLEYTATPNPSGDRTSNVLISTNAHRLKEEGMIKIPIILYEATIWQDAIRRGYEKRNELEEIAGREKEETGEYIRPIMLIQAEYDAETSRGVHVREVEDFLHDTLEIPADQIRIRTGTIDNLEDGNTLLADTSAVRYIITVRALSEGWDNPFAYVLTTLARLGEEANRIQILGRVIRLPNQTRKQNSELNNSYVFTTFDNFENLFQTIQEELNDSGYPVTDIQRGGINRPVQQTEDCEMKNQFKNDDIRIPCIAIRNGNLHKLSFRTDLLGEDFILNEQNIPTNIQFHADRARTIVFDIRQTGELGLGFFGHDTILVEDNDFGKEHILEFLDRKIRRENYTQLDKRAYIERILNSELGNDSDPDYNNRVTRLSMACYPLLEKINEYIDRLEIDNARVNFMRFKEEGLLQIIHESLPHTIKSYDRAYDRFSNHLYSWAEGMNDAERRFAERIDLDTHTKWWFRNREKRDFFIQGWEGRRFYPDFIVKSKSNKYAILEYKGEHLRGNADTRYKEGIGNEWSELAGNDYKFWMVDENTEDDVLTKLDVFFSAE